MKCKDCPHFHIIYQPYRISRTLLDTGRAECQKHDLIVDFTGTRHINRLECVEEEDASN